MRDYLELTKPRITLLILVCTAVGYSFGFQPPFRLLTFLQVLLGTALMASGTAALNQWYEADSDAKMCRTRARPIPAGRMKRSHGFVFAVLLSTAGFVELWLASECANGRPWPVHTAELHPCLHTVEATVASVHNGWGSAWCDASTNRLCGSERRARCQGFGVVPHPFRLAVSALLRDRMDVSRGLCSGRNPNAACDRAGWRIDRQAYRGVLCSAGSDKSGAAPLRNDGTRLSHRRSCSWPGFTSLRCATWARTNLCSRASRAVGFGFVPADTVRHHGYRPATLLSDRLQTNQASGSLLLNVVRLSEWTVIH